jgi:hypothetical protein
MPRILLLSFVVAALGCAAKTPSRPTPDAFLLLRVEPPDATVRVDDRVVGSGRTVAGRWIAVAHGPHRIAVNAPGYDVFEADVELAPGRHERAVSLDVTPER